MKRNLEIGLSRIMRDNWEFGEEENLTYGNNYYEF